MKQRLRFISLPEGVEEIESDAFFGCEALQSITIPKSVKRIGWQIVVCCDKYLHRDGALYMVAVADCGFSAWLALVLTHDQ